MGSLNWTEVLRGGDLTVWCGGTCLGDLGAVGKYIGGGYDQNTLYMYMNFSKYKLKNFITPAYFNCAQPT